MSLYLGTKLALAGDLKNEMSQSGFSAVFHKVSKVRCELTIFFNTFQAHQFESLISMKRLHYINQFSRSQTDKRIKCAMFKHIMERSHYPNSQTS